MDMDAFKFDLMSSMEKWDYFWEYGVLQSSRQTKHIEYFLFRHENIKDIYLELSLVNDGKEKIVRVISPGEAFAKYCFLNKDEVKAPWD